MLRFCCLMKVRRERERSLAHTFAFLCVRAREITHIHTQRTRGYNDGRRGGCAAAEEEGSELIVFLRINIINVIQQSVLDEGAITPGKIHSTSLIGAAIDRPRGSRSAEQCSASGCVCTLRAIPASRKNSSSRVSGKKREEDGFAKWKYYLAKDGSNRKVRVSTSFTLSTSVIIESIYVARNKGVCVCIYMYVFLWCYLYFAL